MVDASEIVEDLIPAVTDISFIAACHATAPEISDRLSSKNVKVINIDGIRVENNYGWWAVRASNTQNALTVRAESFDKNLLKKLTRKIENELKLSGVDFKFNL